MPDLPAHRRPCVRLGISGANRIHRQPESFRQRRGLPAVRLDTMWRVQGHLSGQNRHPANPAPSAMERKHRPASAQMAAEDRAGAAGSAAVREDGALSADDSSAWKIRRDSAEAIRAQWLSASDAGTVRQLDEVPRLPASAPAQTSRDGAAAELNVAELHKIIASVKGALGNGRRSNNSHDAAATAAVPVAQSAQRAELASAFARELEEVGGKFLGILTPAEVTNRIVSLATEIGAKTVALGQGVALDMDAIGEALERAAFRIVRTVPVADTERAAMGARVADADLGSAEADFAIASTGTLAVVSTANRPSSLTLLPPASLVIVQIDHLMPNLAAVLAEMGPGGVAANRLTLITGPSRTADIEKRIVLGVHGPKSLHVIVVWPHDD